MRHARPAALFALLVAPAAAQAERPAADRDGFLAWAERRAIHLESLQPADAGADRFAFLDDALAGKRAALLGETDHLVAERVEFRLLLIRELWRRGYRRIGMEMGRSDALRMDRYLATGDESWLDRVALYGYRGDARDDRDDTIAGWTDDEPSAFRRTALAEARWFLTALREFHAALPADAPRLRWFGYDVSFRPGGGYADVEAMLAPHRDAELVGELRRRLARVADESRIAEAERLESALGWLAERGDAARQLLGAGVARDVRRSIRRMADSFRFVDGMIRRDRGDRDAALAALRAREQRMAANLDELLAEWPADEKFVLLGHALHLSKDSEQLETQSYGRMWPTIGTHLARRLPGEVYGVWLLHDRGRHGVPGREPPVRAFRSPRDAIERALAALGPRFVLPLVAAAREAPWLAAPRVFSVGGSPARAVLPQQTDCLVFVEVATPPADRGRRGR